MMLTLVTGASGHIGGNLVRALLGEGRKVRATVYADTRALQGLDVEGVTCDVTDRAAVEQTLDGVDVVYHCAARIAIRKSDERSALSTNVEGTRHLTAASLAAGVKRFVHFSSIHALSSIPENEPVTETCALVDHSVKMMYDISKAESEQIVLRAVERGLPAVILNPTAVIGPFDYKPSLMGEFLLLLAGGRLPGLVAGGFNWVDVRDVVRGAVSAERNGKVGERYILGGTWRSVFDLSSMIGKIINRQTVRKIIPSFLARLGVPFLALGAALKGGRSLYTYDSLEALTHYRDVSSAKAVRDLKYSPRDLWETLTDTVNWFRERGLLSLEKRGER